MRKKFSCLLTFNIYLHQFQLSAYSYCTVLYKVKLFNSSALSCRFKNLGIQYRNCTCWYTRVYVLSLCWSSQNFRDMIFCYFFCYYRLGTEIRTWYTIKYIISLTACISISFSTGMGFHLSSHAVWGKIREKELQLIL